MHIETTVSRLLHFFSPKSWLIIALVSMAMAIGAALILVAPANGLERHFLNRSYDSVERFLRDTVRLTFKNRVMVDSSDSVFVAPQGILQKDATFKWIENPQDFEARHEEAPPASTAPARLLDSDWAPVFSGLSSDKENP